MELQFFPFDNQVCPMIIESYTNSADLIDLQWARVLNELTQSLLNVITLYINYNFHRLTLDIQHSFTLYKRERNSITYGEKAFHLLKPLYQTKVLHNLKIKN